MGPDENGLICYATGTPIKTGVYACRVDDIHTTYLKSDKFLMWYDNRWSHLNSDQYFRGEVYGWIGPLKRDSK